MISKEAQIFAREKHGGQMRKFEDVPYFNHVENVAKIVDESKESHAKDELVAAAYLHDTLENTKTSEEELKNHFGKLIASLVKELTTDKKETKIVGKDKYLADKMSDPEKMSNWGLVIKLADRLDNVSDLNVSTKEFKKKYTDETNYILLEIEKKRELTETQKKLVEKIRDKLKN